MKTEKKVPEAATPITSAPKVSPLAERFAQHEMNKPAAPKTGRVSKQEYQALRAKMIAARAARQAQFTMGEIRTHTLLEALIKTAGGRVPPLVTFEQVYGPPGSPDRERWKQFYSQDRVVTDRALREPRQPEAQWWEGSVSTPRAWEPED